MLRIATFNVENLDDRPDEYNPGIAERAPVLRAAFQRLRADVICLQEVHGQELPDHTSDDPSRQLSALDRVLEGTLYEAFQRVTTLTTDGTPYDVRNLVILSRFPMERVGQYRNDHIPPLQYAPVTSRPPAAEAKDLRWERPILHARLTLPDGSPLHVLNLHLKSRIPGYVEGQKLNAYTWRSAAGWAEGYFLSSMRRVGQALETRILLDSIFDAEPDARIAVCGDFNAEPGQVPVEAILGRVENTGNAELRSRVMVPCSQALSASRRFTHIHHGEGNLLDHVLISQALLPHFAGAEIHNEALHDESLPFYFERKFPESDHAAFVAEFAGLPS